MNWAVFLCADFEAAIFGQTNIVFYIWLLNASLLQLYLLDP